MDKTILTSNEAIIRIAPYGGISVQAPYHRVHTVPDDYDDKQYVSTKLTDNEISTDRPSHRQWIDAVMADHYRVATQKTIVSIPIHLDGVWVEYDSGVHVVENDVFVIPAGKTVHFLSIEEITVSATVYGTVFPYVIIHPHEHSLFLSPIQVVPVYIRPNSTHRIHVYVTNTTNKPREIYLYRPVAYVKFDRIVSL